MLPDMIGAKAGFDPEIVKGKYSSTVNMLTPILLADAVWLARRSLGQKSGLLPKHDKSEALPPGLHYSERLK